MNKQSHAVGAYWLFGRTGKFWHVAALAILLVAAEPSPLSAALDFWTGGSTVTGNWSDSSNWFPAVPTNGADVVYGLDSNTTNFDDISALNISTLTFSATVVPFTIHIDAGVSLTISGGGVFNNSSNTQTLINDPSPGVVFGGHTVFANSSTASNLAIANNGGNGIASSPGVTFFQDTSSAGSATISNNPGMSAGRNGETIFSGNSTAGTATINNRGLTFFIDATTAGNATIKNDMGGTDFRNGSTADNATITNAGQTVTNSPASPGRSNFRDTASAGSAIIVNNGGAAAITIGGTTTFNDTSTAATATITNNGTSSSGGGGQTDFNDSSSAGSATINNNGGAFSSPGGRTTFGRSFTGLGGNSTAGNATIINNGGGFFFGQGGETILTGFSDASSSTLIANAGVHSIIGPGVIIPGGLGGSIFFERSSTGGTARVEVFGNGYMDISRHASPSVTIGSIEGSGNVFLGANNLTVGSNNLSTNFSGAVQDGGPLSTATGGSLTKIGRGTLTLSGTNTYTGVTTVNKGKLIVDGSIASSSAVTVNAGATLGGHGSVSSIGGAGTISPGDSPGILTATQVNPSGGTSFVFGFTQVGSPTYGNAAASGNDVLHLTGATPFTMALTSANQITVNFSGASLAAGEIFRGGFFADTQTLTSMVSTADFLYTGTGGFTVNFDGFVTEPTAGFASGTAMNGTVLQFKISGTRTSVPDTGSSVPFFGLALAGLALFQRAFGLERVKEGAA